MRKHYRLAQCRPSPAFWSRLGCGILVCLLCAPGRPAAAQPDTPQNSEEVTLHLKWLHAFQFAGYYAAQTQGYYEMEGLRVTIKESTPDNMALEAVLQGQAQFGVWGANLLNRRLDGAPLVVLGVVFQHSPYAVISLWDSGIRVPADLIGKTVAVESEMGLSQLQAMLLHEGLALSAVNVVPHNWTLESLLTGKIDGEFSYTTDQPNRIQMQGVRPSTLLPINYGVDFYGDCLFTTEKEIQDHPERVRAFRSASFQGWEYAMANVAELIDYILLLPGVAERGITREHLAFEAEQMVRLLQPKLIEPGHMNPGRWRHMADTQVRLGMLDADYSLDGFLYDPSSRADTTWLLPLLGSLAVAALIAIMAIVWNLQMRRVINKTTADLRLSEKQLHTLFDTAPVSLWLEDFSGLKQRFEELRNHGVTDFRAHFDEHPAELANLTGLVKVLDVNQESINLHQAANKDELLASLSDTFTESSLAVFKEEMIALAEGQQQFEADTMLQTLAGEEIHVFLRLVLGGESDDWSKTYIALVDISERRRAEENRFEMERQLQHGQKLESLGILAGGIAHDFNNLLTAILGNADLALDDLPHTARSRPYLTEIHRASHRAADLCRQMLAYSGRGRFEIKFINLNELASEMAHLLQSVIPKKVKFRQEFCEPGPVIEADSAQLQQVVMNLISNAAEAIGDRVGTVTISTEFRDCDVAFLHRSRLANPIAPGNYAALVVSDDGEGMTGETLGKLFDPFYSTKFSGRGLGLSAVLGIVRGHQGAIIVDSELGQGTTITVLFPLAEQSQPTRDESDQSKSSATAWTGEGTVLLVDDEEGVRKVAGRMLKSMGFEVLLAEDGLRAVEVFQNHSVAIRFVVLDLTMPGLSGEEAFARMREINPQVPVLMASGYSHAELDLRFSSQSACGFIQKPFTRAQLRDKIRRVIEGDPA